MNQYLKTQEEIRTTPLSERWKFYIAREYFTNIAVRESQEPLVSEEILSSAGLLIEPIWKDVTLDEEGVAYSKYISKTSLPGWMREGVARRLMAASAVLSSHRVQIVLKAGYRPLEVQLELFDEVRKTLSIKYPELEANQLREMTRDYVSDPSQIIPPHTAGAAVDVALRDANGTLIDMGCGVNQGEDIAWSNYPNISDAQKENRALLRNAMLGAGFAPIGSEWWHYSYGDQIWAAYYQKPYAIYGIYDK